MCVHCVVFLNKNKMENEKRKPYTPTYILNKNDVNTPIYILTLAEVPLFVLQIRG